MHKTLLSTAISGVLAGSVAWAQAEPHQEHRQHLEEIVVRAIPFQRSSLEAAEPVQVLVGDQLHDNRGLTLGETLQHQPGVQSSYYGPGAARPVIRGLSGPRVTILEDGLSTADGSAPSDDHAVTLDPMLVDQIEVLRGPATLLYGSGAVGGVVNVIDNRIPEAVPDEPLAGRFELRGNTAANERTGLVRLDGGQGRFAWHLDGSLRDAGDTDIPGRARLEADDDHEQEFEHDPDHELELDRELGPEGRLENSFVESQSGTLGLGWVADRGFVGGSFRRFETDYGIPAPHSHDSHDHETEDEHGLEEDHSQEEGHEPDEHDSDNEFAAIDMRQNSWDIKAGLNEAGAALERATLRLGYNDYRHRELDLGGDEAEGDHEAEHEHQTEGTVFDIATFQGRLELETRPYGGWSGAFGMDYRDRDFRVEGAEAFVPDHDTRRWALFALQERALGPVTLSLGARIEDTQVRVTETGLAPEHDHDPEHEAEDEQPVAKGDRRSFTGLSLAAGGVWRITDIWQSSLNLSRSERAPSGTELFANGPHLATFSFERGDPALREEITEGVDLSLHRHVDALDLEVTFFYKDIEDFVFLAETGAELDGLPLRTSRQQDASFHGLEFQATWQIHDTSLGNFDLRAGYDQVRGELAVGGYLPRISPDRIKLGVDWHRGPWRANIDWHRVDRQNRVASFETPTGSYQLVSASLVYELNLSASNLELFVQGRNLTDEHARVHTSFLKDFAPLPGRNLIAGVRGRF